MEPGKRDELVEVRKCWGEAEAEFYQVLLRSYGIESVFRGESTRLTHPVTVSKLSEVRLMVRPEDAERARDLIEDIPHKKSDRPVNSE